jgi:DNA replication protein DnaC
MAVTDTIPVRYAGRRLRTLDVISDQTAAVRLAKDWLEEAETGKSPSWGIAMVGPPGTGKTAIACALAVDADDMGLSVDFITMPDLRAALFRQMDLMDIIRKLETLTDESPELVEHRARNERLWLMSNEVDLLIIDDLGRENVGSTRFIEDQIDNLIRHRGDRGLSMVVTSNLERKERVGRYGEPLESYLHEVCEFVAVAGDDRRRGD